MGGCCSSGAAQEEATKRNENDGTQGILDIMIRKPNSTSLKVGTYDLSNFTDHPNWEKRVQAIANLIRESGCDVVALQQLRYDANQENLTEPPFDRDFSLADLEINQPHMLVDLLKLLPEYPFARWKPVMEYSSDVVEGIGLISKIDINEDLQFVHLAATSEADQNQRGLIACQIERSGKIFDIFITHLSTDTEIQEEQVKELITIVHSESSGHIQILLGNFGFENDDFANIIEAELEPGDKVFKDVAKTQPNVFNTFPSTSPTSRPDRIYAKGDYIQISNVIAAGLAIDENDASKHLFLYASISQEK